MLPLTIAAVKDMREMMEAAQLIIVVVDSEGTQHVATHGAEEWQAKEAAALGNRIKERVLGWPKDQCVAKPLVRSCKNCTYWKVDWGTYCFNGWTGDGTSGWCRFEPKHTKTESTNKCGFFSPNC